MKSDLDRIPSLVIEIIVNFSVQVDRVCRDLLRPSATPDQVDLQLVAAGAGTGRHWLRCPVRGVAGLEYRATGLAGLRDGVYTRGQSGPDFCVYVGP